VDSLFTFEGSDLSVLRFFSVLYEIDRIKDSCDTYASQAACEGEVGRKIAEGRDADEYQSDYSEYSHDCDDDLVSCCVLHFEFLLCVCHGLMIA